MDCCRNDLREIPSTPLGTGSSLRRKSGYAQDDAAPKNKSETLPDSDILSTLKLCNLPLLSPCHDHGDVVVLLLRAVVADVVCDFRNQLLTRQVAMMT